MTTGNILVLDVGGSFLKYGVADEKGALLPGSVGEVPARADESPEKVYEAFEEVIRRARETWFLVDDTKFAQVYPAVICDLHSGAILTNRCPNPKYRQYTLIKETEV